MVSMFLFKDRKLNAKEDEVAAAPQQGDALEARCNALAEGYGFTPRETEILVLLGQGRTARGISEKLYVSENTVKYHIKSIYQKLGVHARGEVIDLIAVSYTHLDVYKRQGDYLRCRWQGILSCHKGMASSLETGLPPTPPLFVRFPGCWPCWRWHTVKGAIMDDAKDSKARLTRRSFLGLGATAAVVAAGAGLAACSPTAAAESASGASGGSAAASGAASWRTPPSAPDDVAEEAQCDVLVIGLGHAGSCAARAAAEAGAVVYALSLIHILKATSCSGVAFAFFGSRMPMR